MNTNIKCPKCDKEMEIIKEDESHNPDNGKKYSRKLHVCTDCDVWVSFETPA